MTTIDTPRVAWDARDERETSDHAVVIGGSMAGVLTARCAEARVARACGKACQ